MYFRILRYTSLESTNNLAKDFAERGAAEGTVIVTNYQTKGRGRKNRRWMSSRGKDLLFSVIVRPPLRAGQISILTHLTGQAVKGVLADEFDMPSKIKRPNDVLVGGKKIAGILTEATGKGQKTDFVVIGVGINVNAPKRLLLKTATSVIVETKRKADRDRLLVSFLDLFRRMYEEVVLSELSMRTA